MELSASSTLLGLLKHKAVTHPDRPAISTPGGQKLTVARLSQLEGAAASCILSSGVLPGDRVALVFGNTAESVIMILGAIRCRAVAVPMHPAAYTQEEFEIFLSEYEIKLLLTGPPSSDDETPAQAAAARLRIPHAIASVDFHSIYVDISAFLLPTAPSASAGARDLAEVVNKPWDAALLLHGARGDAGSGAVMLTQGQLASVVMEKGDVLNLLSELKSCLADVKFVENHYFLENLSDMIPAACVASRPSNAARVAVWNPTTIGGLVTGRGKVPHGLLAATGELPEVVAGIARAEEHVLKLTDMFMLSAVAVAVLATVLSRQPPQAAAEKARLPFLLFFLALISSYMGQILKTELGRFLELFKMGSLFLCICGTAGLAVSLFPPACGYTVLVVTVAVGLVQFTPLLLNLLGRAPPPPPTTAV